MYGRGAGVAQQEYGGVVVRPLGDDADAGTEEDEEVLGDTARDGATQQHQ